MRALVGIILVGLSATLVTAAMETVENSSWYNVTKEPWHENPKLLLKYFKHHSHDRHTHQDGLGHFRTAEHVSAHQHQERHEDGHPTQLQYHESNSTRLMKQATAYAFCVTLKKLPVSTYNYQAVLRLEFSAATTFSVFLAHYRAAPQKITEPGTVELMLADFNNVTYHGWRMAGDLRKLSGAVFVKKGDPAPEITIAVHSDSQGFLRIPAPHPQHRGTYCEKFKAELASMKQTRLAWRFLLVIIPVAVIISAIFFAVYFHHVNSRRSRSSTATTGTQPQPQTPQQQPQTPQQQPQTQHESPTDRTPLLSHAPEQSHAAPPSPGSAPSHPIYPELVFSGSPSLPPPPSYTTFIQARPPVAPMN